MPLDSVHDTPQLRGGLKGLFSAVFQRGPDPGVRQRLLGCVARLGRIFEEVPDEIFCSL